MIRNLSISQVGKDILSKQHIVYQMQQEYNSTVCSGIPPTHLAFDFFYHQTLLVAHSSTIPSSCWQVCLLMLFFSFIPWHSLYMLLFSQKGKAFPFPLLWQIPCTKSSLNSFYFFLLRQRKAHFSELWQVVQPSYYGRIFSYGRALFGTHKVQIP